MVGSYLVPRRIEFLVTNMCNGRCRHCYAQKYAAVQPRHVDEFFAVDIVRRVGEEYDVESVMTFGGEPMLFPDLVCSIHGEATKQEIPSRQLITNGYWSDSSERTREIAMNLAVAGVNDITFSVDAFHQEHIPLDRVKDTVRLCLEAGIEDLSLSPCWLVSEDNDNRYNLETASILEELAELSVRVSGGNVVEPEGEAVVNLNEFMPSRVSLPSGKCGDLPYTEPLDRMTCISVETDGRVSICDELFITDSPETDILSAIRDYDPYERPETKAIIEHGMEALLELASSMGVKPDPEGYYTVCQMCTDIRKRILNKRFHAR